MSNNIQSRLTFPADGPSKTVGANVQLSETTSLQAQLHAPTKTASIGLTIGNENFQLSQSRTLTNPSFSTTSLTLFNENGFSGGVERNAYRGQSNDRLFIGFRTQW